MQTDLPAALLYSEVVVRKAVRWNVPLSALALKVMRNEVVVPLLAAPVALPARARRCPAWRVHLHAVTMLTYWHGYDVIVGFAAELAREAAVDTLGASADSREAREGVAATTPLYRVAHVVTDVLEWWRQPQARDVLTAVPEADLWAAFVLRAQGDSSWEAHASPVLVKLMSGDLPSLRRPTPVELRQGDITAFVHSFKMTLLRYRCLQAPAGVPESAVVRALTISPGCPSLRRFMRTPEGRAAYVRPHAAEPGLTGVVVRALARSALAVNMLRDMALLWLDGAVSRSSATWGAIVQPQAAAAPPPHPQTLFEWMASTDPWTVFGTSVAALLAVLRVVVRLTSAFSTAATLSVPPSPATPAPAVTAAPEAPPVPATATRKSSKRGAKGRHKAARAVKSTPTTSRAPEPKQAASAEPAPRAPEPPPPPPAPCPSVFDPIAQRFRTPGSSGLSSQRELLPLAEVPVTEPAISHLRTAMLPARLGDLRPPLAAAVCAALPSLLYMPPAALVRCAARSAKASSQPPSPTAKADADAKLCASDSPCARGECIPSSGGVPCPHEPPQTVSLLEGFGGVGPVSEVGGPLPCDLSAKLQVYRKEECGHVPELFLCPISREIMENPVLASDGHVYERAQIEAWLKAHQTSPMTNMAMRPEVAPVLSLRSEIQAFKQRFPHIV